MAEWYGGMIERVRESAADPAEEMEALYAAACENGASAEFDPARAVFVSGYLRLGEVERAWEVHQEITEPLAVFESLKSFVRAHELPAQEAADRGALLAIDEDNRVVAAQLWERLAYFAEWHLPPDVTARFKIQSGNAWRPILEDRLALQKSVDEVFPRHGLADRVRSALHLS